MTKTSVSSIITCILLTCLTVCASAQTRLRVMEWNVENLFDCQHDTLKNDYEFLPEAERRWTPYRYWCKLDEVGKVIMAVSEDGTLPTLVGLCEVENDTVMRDLTKRSPLRNVSYGYVMTDSPDQRGVDVALLYKKGMFRLLGHESKRVPSVEHGFSPTRDILHAWGLIHGGDTLHAIVCHLPSRSGGLTQSDRHRALAARTLRGLIDSLQTSTPRLRLVVMGDFNATPSDVIFREVLRPLRASQEIKPNMLYTLMPAKKKDLLKEWGTYRYQGLWSFIDHILVAGLRPICDEKGYFVQPITFPWLFEANKTYGGLQPRRTFRGPSYHGGISDHLPIVADVEAP